MSPTVLLILHAAGTDTALLEDVLLEQGTVAVIVRLHEGEPIPDLAQSADVAGIVVLGGPMGAYEADRYPFLNQSMRLLHRAIDLRLPTLAICLGAQLLARVAGGTAYSGDVGLEWGFVPVRLSDAGRADPVLAGMEGEHFSYHSDTFDLPVGIDLLAHSPSYRQAFRVGSGLGLQFHPELSVPGMHRLIARCGRDTPLRELRRARAQAAARRLATRQTLTTLLARWAAPARR